MFPKTCIFAEFWKQNTNDMDYLAFRERMYPYGCFNINQVLLWEKDFDRNNLTRWCKKGLLIKLRNEHYAFPEYMQVADFQYYVANRIYRPSYISLHSALSFYGMIPEEVVQLTSATTCKPNRFENHFGSFSYHHIKIKMFFGYELKQMQNGRTLLFATPEKALIDLLYLYPFYKSEADMLDLRLDEYFIQEELNRERLNDYLTTIDNHSLTSRIHILLKVYGQ